MNIYLLRHGETSWNHERRLQGVTDVGLNDVGVRQSRQLTLWFRGTNITPVITSPLRRARHTAQMVSERTSCRLVTEDHLREIDHGPWTGLRVTHIERKFPAEFAAWRFSPENFRLPGSESLKSAYRRSSYVLSRLIATNRAGDVLVVSHGVINALFLCAAMGVSLSRVWGFPQSNGRVGALRVERRQLVTVESEIDAAA